MPDDLFDPDYLSWIPKIAEFIPIPDSDSLVVTCVRSNPGVYNPTIQQYLEAINAGVSELTKRNPDIESFRIVIDCSVVIPVTFEDEPHLDFLNNPKLTNAAFYFSESNSPTTEFICRASQPKAMVASSLNALRSHLTLEEYQIVSSLITPNES